MAKVANSVPKEGPGLCLTPKINWAFSTVVSEKTGESTFNRQIFHGILHCDFHASCQDQCHRTSCVYPTQKTCFIQISIQGCRVHKLPFLIKPSEQSVKTFNRKHVFWGTDR